MIIFKHPQGAICSKHLVSQKQKQKQSPSHVPDCTFVLVVLHGSVRLFS